MTYEEFSKRQKELLDECDKLRKLDRFCEYLDKMQEFLDLGEQYLNEKQFFKEVFI